MCFISCACRSAAGIQAESALDTECVFPSNYAGDWLLYERSRIEDVKIESGQITFSKLGRFVCKSRHHEKNVYKLLSAYTNGWYVTAPRVTSLTCLFAKRRARHHSPRHDVRDITRDVTVGNHGNYYWHWSIFYTDVIYVTEYGIICISYFW